MIGCGGWVRCLRERVQVQFRYGQLRERVQDRHARREVLKAEDDQK